MSTRVFQDITKVDDRTLTFRLTPTRVTYANIIRRAVQTEVNILGFRADMTETGSTTDVKVFKNTTPMSNEMLADRIGLLPIAMPANIAGWDKDKIVFRLKVVNDTEELRMVTASDFECLEKRDDEEERVRIPNTQFFHPNPVTGETCLIAVLKPQIEGQEPEEVHLEAYATLGNGREHARFNPVSQCSYKYTLDDEPGRVKALWVRWLTEQKKVDAKELEGDADRKAVLEREFRSLEIQRCYLEDEEGEPYSFNFTVETVGTLPVHDSIYQALIGVGNMAMKYASIDKGDLPDTLEIRPADARLQGFDFWFTGEDHTLGNLLQTWLDDTLVGRGQEGNNVTFTGYKVPHPLRNEMVLRIGVSDGKAESARIAIAKAAKATADMYYTWASQWQEATSSIGMRPVESVKTTWEAHGDTKMREMEKDKSAMRRGRGRGRGK
jgi:DNA-directed RNA polymerase subunit L/DNA-directed RNA polymerase alpha subunit